MSLPNARIELIIKTAASSGAANTDVAFRPEAGEIWEVLMIFGYNDDGTPWHYWLWTDITVTLSEITRKQASASYDYLYLGNNNNNPAGVPFMAGPLTVTYKSFPTYRWVATQAAKNGTVKALVRRYFGMDEP